MLGHEHRAATAIALGIGRRRRHVAILRDDRRRARIDMRNRIEQPSAGIGEIQPPLRIGHIDAVRHEEVRAQQHIGVDWSQIGDVEAHIVQFLIADLQQLEPGDPVAHGMAAHAIARPRRLHPGSPGWTPARAAALSETTVRAAPVSNVAFSFAPSSSTVPTVW